MISVVDNKTFGLFEVFTLLNFLKSYIHSFRVAKTDR